MGNLFALIFAAIMAFIFLPLGWFVIGAVCLIVVFIVANK